MPDIKGKLGQQDSRTAGRSLFARVRETLKQIPFIYYPVHYTRIALRSIKLFIKWQFYKHTFKFNKNGLNTTDHRPRKIIASLTSYPARIHVVPYVIASLLNQTMKPDKIILWLAESQFPDKKLPELFDEVKACGVEVRFCPEDLGPHKKYFYAMQEYPEDIVITFDDDFLYSKRIIETLYNCHREHPDCVSGIIIHQLTFSTDGSLQGFFEWNRAYRNAAGTESLTYLTTTGGGNLFPPHSVHKEALNIEAMMTLCPKADDMWLKFMEVMNGTRVACASNNPQYGRSPVPFTQKTALKYFNDAGGGNDAQVKAILEHYSGWRDEKGRTILEVIREDQA